jgi:hypothetical protein
MKPKVLSVMTASALLGWAGLSLAQTSYGSGESARCDTMTGEQKEQCLRDEANKAQGTPKDPSSVGATREATPAERYGRSPHCDTMTGADKESCLQDEARKGDSELRKDQNPATSKTGD